MSELKLINLHEMECGAQALFDTWNDTTGALPEGTSWHAECKAVIEDVVGYVYGKTLLLNRRPAARKLTMEELEARTEPVYVPVASNRGDVGYWCLCNNGWITPPSLEYFKAKERPDWIFYDRKPEE